MESQTAASKVSESLELIRVGSAIFLILFGAMFVLNVPLLVRDALNRSPYLGRDLLMTTALALIVLGLLAMHSPRYARASVRRWNNRLRMSRTERIRRGVLATAGAAASLTLYFLGPSVIGATLWPSQSWSDYQIAAQPIVWIVGSAGFASLMWWRWADRSNPTRRATLQHPVPAGRTQDEGKGWAVRPGMMGQRSENSEGRWTRFAENPRGGSPLWVDCS